MPSIVRRIVLVLVIILLFSNILYATGIQRHGEDIGSIPLIITIDDYRKTIKSLHGIVNNTSISDNLLRLLALSTSIMNNTSSKLTSILLNITSKLREMILENPNPLISRYDYTRLALILSVVDYYNGSLIIDPLLFIELLKSYEKARQHYILENIKIRDPELAILIENYLKLTQSSNTMGSNKLLAIIRSKVKEYVEKGNLDIIPLVVEVLKQGINDVFVIDRIMFAKYVNNTSILLEEQGLIDIARKLRRIASQLYGGFIVKSWRDLELLREEVIKLNITLTQDLVLKLAPILAVTSITYDGIYINLKDNPSIIQTIASILTLKDYTLRRKIYETIILGSSLKHSPPNKEQTIDITSFMISQVAMGTSSSGLELLSLRQPLSVNYRIGEDMVVKPIESTSTILIIIVSSIGMLAILIHSVLELSKPIHKIEEKISQGYKPSISFEDSKARIVEVYIKALLLLEAKGYGRKPWETPREHLNRVKYIPCYEGFKRIVEYYEETVFSDHDLEPSIINEVYHYLKMVEERCG